ncbi:AAA family ATPase [Vibrio sp. 10N.222.51.C8]|jgi:cobaltochelatase CobS|uniref:ATPase dynein-related AAA domain-containing protein n=4 Tax=Vibrio TaxID=662 RepID=A0A7Z1S2P3_9VIBR|nr:MULTISPECIES: AAA family ATPase [Vibrio]OQQ07368.1 hypothetical protein BK411_13535 [Vibrio splendidus]MDA0155474.1 AAA family ATPase [Vibrio sp. Makdt]MDC5725629.1 AAA family ATPase [Vibrio europaeus]MDC5728231.1 AAA family ATPase [Vibrio europaeus]MDC5734443.1 AAA family ATPase [Vibrio europaeus]
MSNANPVTTVDTNNQPTSTVEEIDYSEMITVRMADVFKPFVPAAVTAVIQIPKHRHPDVPREIAGYIPDEKQLSQVISWFCSPQRPNFMHMVGPTGSGKTDFMLWLCARLNWPTVLVSVNPTLRPEKMQGRWVLSNGQTEYVYGPIADAMKHGKCVLLDECDKGSLDFIAKLHLPSEMTKPWSIEDTGEIIYPHQNYRFVTLGNTSGEGDISGLYPSSRRWDTAFRNRSFVVPFPYLRTEVEEKVVIGKFPFLRDHKKLLKKLIQFANAMRDAMLGPNRDRTTKSGIGTAFSTRVVLSWCYYIQINGDRAPLRASFNNVFWNGCDTRDKADIEKIIDQVFKDKNGHILDQPYTWLKEQSKK